MDLIRLENELKKRWIIPYTWKGTKQTNELDSKTNFIYKTYSFKRLLENTSSFEVKLKNYAYNRWYNFWSAQAVEYIFSSHDIVEANKNKFDKLVDFEIDYISFDHKTSVFPKRFNPKFEYYEKNKIELIEWLYKNQSQEGRKHLKNRLFIVLFESESYSHWQMKAEISLIKSHVDLYVRKFEKENLVSLKIEDQEILSDVIFIKK